MSEEAAAVISRQTLLRMATDIVSAYVGQNQVAAAEIPDLIQNVYGALGGLVHDGERSQAAAPRPAVPVRRSVTPDFIICLEDGRKLKMLKRHLRTTFNMTPEEYRSRWNLPSDYPMVAPNYAKRRSDFAKKIGLGRSRAN
jgi:predicted transcriptional regulator